MSLGHQSDAPLAARWTAVIRRLAACSRRLRRQLADVTAIAGLNDSEFLLMALCREAPEHGWSQSQLADGVGLSPAQVSGLVEGLRHRGLLAAQPAPRDRRRQLWTLTTAGQQLLDSVWHELNALAHHWQQSLEGDSHSLLHWLNRLADGAATHLSVNRRGGGNGGNSVQEAA